MNNIEKLIMQLMENHLLEIDNKYDNDKIVILLGYKLYRFYYDLETREELGTFAEPLYKFSISDNEITVKGNDGCYRTFEMILDDSINDTSIKVMKHEETINLNYIGCFIGDTE